METWTVLIDTLRFASIGVLILYSLVLLKAPQRDRQVWVSVALCLATISYLLADWNLIQNTPFKVIILSGAFSLSVIFWLFARVLFGDDFKFNWQQWLILAAVIVINYMLFFGKTRQWFADAFLSAIVSFLSQTISFVFIFLAILTAYKDRESDLVEERFKFRKQFILALTVLIGLTLLAEIALRRSTVPEILEFAQKFAIATLISYFGLKNLDFNAGFFLSKEKKSPPPVEFDAEMLARLKALLEKEKIYRREGLTIRMLADELGEKEYKVRRLINQHLGFRNFNDFLNQYRIQDACEILLDEKQADLTILELAYFLGYQSLGPFNSAFKKQTGLTPTAYRKQHLNKTQ